MKNYLPHIQLGITILVLIVTATIGFEKQNSINSTDIAVIKQKVENIETNTNELKDLVQNHIIENQKTQQDFEKRLLILEAENNLKTDNTRVLYTYRK